MALDPGPALRALAQRAETMADTLRSQAADVRAHRTTPGWTGRAADSAAIEADAAAAALQRAAARMDDVASALRTHGTRAAQEYHELADSITGALKKMGSVGL